MTPSEDEPPTPLASATHAWSMDDRSASPLRAVGDVTFGVDVGDGRAAVGGGTGTAARLEGGYMAVPDGELDLNPDAFTLAVRMRDPAGAWEYPVLGSYGSDEDVSVALRAVDGRSKPFRDRNHVGEEVSTVASWLFRDEDGPRAVTDHTSLIEAVWGAREANRPRVERLRDRQGEDTWPNPLQQDVCNAAMRVCFPVGLLDPAAWRDLVVRMTGPKLQLFVDGVLVDEEYPVGRTRAASVPFLVGAAHEDGDLRTGFRGLIAHVGVWNRAISDEEVVALSGGAAAADRHERALLGTDPERVQHFRPRGHNRKAGDCIPFWDAEAERFRLFYLVLRRNMHSKWDGGHGGLEIWQTSTADLETWDHHPVTVPVTEQWEAWNGTGSVAYHDGRYHWFYPCPDYDGDRGGIQRAVSADGVHFEKTPATPFLPGGDTELHQSPDGTFHLLRGGETRTTADGETRATVERLTSPDLETWTPVEDPFIETDVSNVAMCPNLFEFGDWFYFVGGNQTWRSRQRFGPWTRHEPSRLEPLLVPKTARFGDDRRLFAGFLRDNGWGGNLFVRELVQDADGWLGTRFVPEMVPETGPSLPGPAARAPAVDGDALAVDGAAGTGETTLSGVDGDYRLRMDVVPGSDPAAFGVELCADAAAGSGCELRFDPGADRVAFSDRVGSGGIRRSGPGIDGVAGLGEAFSVDVVVRHDIVDVEVDGRRTLATRYWNPDADRLRLFAEDGTVEFSDVRLARVTDTYRPYP